MLSDTGAHFVALGRWAVTIARIPGGCRWRVAGLAGPGRPRYGSARDWFLEVVKLTFLEDVFGDGGESRLKLFVVVG